MWSFQHLLRDQSSKELLSAQGKNSKGQIIVGYTLTSPDHCTNAVREASKEPYVGRYLTIRMAMHDIRVRIDVATYAHFTTDLET
jgi:hypothetical protein